MKSQAVCHHLRDTRDFAKKELACQSKGHDKAKVFHLRERKTVNPGHG